VDSPEANGRAAGEGGANEGQRTWTRFVIVRQRGKGARESEGRKTIAIPTWRRIGKNCLNRHQASVTPWKARGIRVFRSLTPIEEHRSWLWNTQCGGSGDHHFGCLGATSRARGADLTHAPPADGRRELAASGSAKRWIRAARQAGITAARAKNPGIPLRTSDLAKGRPVKGNRRRTKTPHRANSGCGGRKRSNRP